MHERDTPLAEEGATCLLSSIRTIPSAPASHRICWPFRRNGRRSRARGKPPYRRWGIAPRP